LSDKLVLNGVQGKAQAVKILWYFLDKYKYSYIFETSQCQVGSIHESTMNCFRKISVAQGHTYRFNELTRPQHFYGVVGMLYFGCYFSDKKQQADQK
jgi:hypothetical protein